MKKLVVTLTILVLPLILTACIKKPITTSTNLIEEDDGKTVEIKTGNTFTVTLGGNITTGYAWEISDIDETYVIQQGEVESIYSNPGLVGAPETNIFTFRTLKEGNTKLKLKYWRSFEKHVPPIRTFNINIEIK